MKNEIAGIRIPDSHLAAEATELARQMSAPLDITGNDLKELSADEVDEVLQAYPRLDFKRAFPQAIADMLASKPETAFYNFTADIAERLIPGFHAPNFYDVILAAPFKE